MRRSSRVPLRWLSSVGVINVLFERPILQPSYSVFYLEFYTLELITVEFNFSTANSQIERI